MAKNKDMPEQRYQIILFEDKNIRRVWHEGEWFYSIVDLVGLLTESPRPRKYWSDMKKRENQLSEICGQLKLLSSDGKYYKTDVVNNQNALRQLAA